MHKSDIEEELLSLGEVIANKATVKELRDQPREARGMKGADPMTRCNSTKISELKIAATQDMGGLTSRETQGAIPRALRAHFDNMEAGPMTLGNFGKHDGRSDDCVRKLYPGKCVWVMGEVNSESASGLKKLAGWMKATRFTTTPAQENSSSSGTPRPKKEEDDRKRAEKTKLERTQKVKEEDRQRKEGMAKPVPTGPDSEEEKLQLMKSRVAPRCVLKLVFAQNMYLKKVNAWMLLQRDETESTSGMDVKQENRKGAATSSFSNMESWDQRDPRNKE